MWKNNRSDSLPADMPDFIAYPCEGYMPATLVFEKWSFSIPKADFSNANVTMADNEGNNIDLYIVFSNEPGTAPDKRIVWEPLGINTSIAEDQTITVTVSNISGAESASFTYDVIIFQPTAK